VAGVEAYLHAKFHLDPSNRMATIHQHHRQIGQIGQRSDSIGRLQTVAHKLKADLVASCDIRPADGEGLSLVSVLHKSVTYLLS